MLSWFDAKEAKAFGAELGLFFLARMPDAQLGEKAFAKKTDELLGKMAGMVHRFVREHRLNPYKKAQLGNAFKWSLLDGGVQSAYVDKLVDWLMLQLP